MVSSPTETTITYNEVTVSASFTADPLQPFLALIIERLELPLSIKLTPYHQVFQELLTPNSLSSSNSNGINLWLIRLEDYVCDITNPDVLIEKASSVANELLVAFGQFSTHCKAISVVMMLPCSPKVEGPIASQLNDLSLKLLDSLSGLNGIVPVGPKDLNQAGFDFANQYDAYSNDLAHIPFTEQGFASLALALARKLHMLKTTAKKVLILDCDNTIWQGVVGEDGVDGIKLTPQFLAVQQFAVDVQKQGVLICLASKNVEQDVMEVFAKRPDMVLKPEHIVAHRINWEHKSKNIESLAVELNLGLDSFVFIDDNPVECGQMRQLLPQVLTIQLPEPAEIEPLLKNLWVFDKLSVTDEDTKRTQMYRENNARQQLESSATDISAFLSSLELVIDINIPLEEEWPRVSQLTQRTNQFNFTTIRRNETEMRALSKTDDHFILKVNVKDRFGDYGLVGDIVALKKSNSLIVDTFLLSCRVLGRGVEHAMLRHVATLAKEQNCDTVEIEYIRTAKNEPAYAFAEQMIGKFRQGDTSNAKYILPTDILAETAYVPGSDPEAVLEAKRSETKKKPANTQVASSVKNISDRYEFLLHNHDNTRLVNALNIAQARNRNIDTPLIKASNQDEQKMLNLWQKVLGVREIGMEDNYFELGGTSLLTAKLFAEIANCFNTELRLTVILNASTPKLLLTAIQSPEQTLNKSLIPLKQGKGKSLFLIHDGDGETLLYMNLANHLPNNVAVFGIEPHALPKIPMAHASINEMATHYMQLILEQSPEGPYYLGGMCAGGLIAYVIGDLLAAKGHDVRMVAMLDSAVPHAKQISGLATQARIGRLGKMFEDIKAQDANILRKAYATVTGIIKRVFNVIYWELSSRYRRFYRDMRFNKLKAILRKQQNWPAWMKPLSVREIYNSAEIVATLPKSNVKTLLIRATEGQNDDIPYQLVYAEKDFGWQLYAQNLTVIDTPGGHASMLQEPHAFALAQIIKPFLLEPQ